MFARSDGTFGFEELRRDPAHASKNAVMTLPLLAVVSGPAGSGKTTLAHELARAIGCPAICRDEIKEGMVHAAGSPFRAEPGDPLTERTLTAFFDLLELLLDAGVTVVAEAAFQDRVWRAHLAPLSERSRMRIIQCQVDAATARQRMVHREVRPAHADQSVLTDSTYFATFKRVSLPVPTIDVNTTNGYEPSISQVVRFLNADGLGPN
jgi:predicted kinase